MSRLHYLPAGLFLFLLVTGCASTRPAEESADMIVRYSMQEDQLNEMMGMGFGMTDNPLMSAMQDDMVAFLKKHLDLDGLRSEMRTFYLERFSAEELAVIADFHATPAAQKFQAMAPELVMLNAARMRKVMVDHRDEFMEMLQKHAPAGVRPPGSQR